jgi:peptide/nickel transport system permease protein
MLKYILKRLCLSVVVLFGVSLIIYFLVRLMPTDYLENKFSAQLQQGTITSEQIDSFKKNYGLYMPEAYLDITVNGGEYDGAVLRRDVKTKAYSDLENGYSDFKKFYTGSYTLENTVKLELKDDSSFTMYKLIDGTPVRITSGTYVAQDGKITLNSMSGEAVYNVNYSEARLWDKFVAILGGYCSWLGNMLRGDFGESFLYQLPVNRVIAEHMWISFAISLVALILQFAIAIPLGIISATRQYSVTDYAVTVITMIGISLPSFFFAALLIKVFSSWLGWFPASGLVSAGGSSAGLAYVLDMLHHLILPMLVLVVLSIGGLMRYTRTNMLEVLNSDYIRTARSKGLSEKKVIYVHAFRNTMIPLMTLLAGILPSLFGGAMITEEVFAIEGIGRLAYKALQQGDVPFIMGYNMFLAVLTVIGTLLSDLMYAVVDPRVKLSK